MTLQFSTLIIVLCTPNPSLHLTRFKFNLTFFCHAPHKPNLLSPPLLQTSFPPFPSLLFSISYPWPDVPTATTDTFPNLNIHHLNLIKLSLIQSQFSPFFNSLLNPSPWLYILHIETWILSLITFQINLQFFLLYKLNNYLIQSLHVNLP